MMSFGEQDRPLGAAAGAKGPSVDGAAPAAGETAGATFQGDRSLGAEEAFAFADRENGPCDAGADRWPAFADLDAGKAGRSAATVGVQREREAAGGAPARRPDAATIRRFSGVLAFVLGAAMAGFGPSSTQNGTQVVQVPAVHGAEEPDSLVCLGDFRRTLEEGMDVHEVDERVSSASMLLADGAASIGGAALGGDGLEVKVGEAVSGVFEAEEAGTVIAGSFAHSAQAGDLRGTASLACGRASMEQYLTGSQTAVGTSNELILYNPGAVAARVNVEAIGSAGELSVFSAEQVMVDAGAARRILLDGIADSDSRVAFRVFAEAGAVLAALQETVLAGATPAGVTFVPAGQAGRRLVVPAVSSSGGLESATLRIANWGEEPATASVRVFGVSGPAALAGLESVTVAPKTVVDVPVEDIDGAIAAVVVDADRPVSAGVRLARQEEEGAPRDIAWAAPVKADRQAAGTVGTLGGRLLVAAEEAADVTMHAYDATGVPLEPVSVRVEAGHGVPVEIGAAALRLEASSPVHAAVVAESALDDGHAIDWLALLGPRESSTALRIAVR